MPSLGLDGAETISHRAGRRENSSVVPDGLRAEGRGRNLPSLLRRGSSVQSGAIGPSAPRRHSPVKAGETARLDIKSLSTKQGWAPRCGWQKRACSLLGIGLQAQPIRHTAYVLSAGRNRRWAGWPPGRPASRRSWHFWLHASARACICGRCHSARRPWHWGEYVGKLEKQIFLTEASRGDIIGFA